MGHLKNIVVLMDVKYAKSCDSEIVFPCLLSIISKVEYTAIEIKLAPLRQGMSEGFEPWH